MFGKLIKKDTFSEMRFKLFAINIGALLTIWVILLSLVYSLMARELYQILDNQLRNFASHTIHSYMDGRRSRAHVYSDTNYSFSLWQRVPGNTIQFSVFIDGNPFVSPVNIYETAINSSDGIYKTIQVEGIPYRAFYAIVHSHKGDYIIRVAVPTGPTNITLSNLLWTLGIAGFAALGLTIVVGLWLSSRSLSPSIIAWKRQQQFVADASHELRTPLAIIKTNLEVLLRHPENTIENEIHWLGNAYSEVLRTTTLIEDLLTLARADSKEALIEHKVIDLAATLHEVVDSVRPLAEEQEKMIQLEVPEFPCKTVGDIKRLRQLMLILLDNALHYTSQGGKIKIVLGCDTNYAQIEVKDTGIGIPAELLPKIFDRFTRGDTSRHRENQGSGLGLSIAKWIVDAHHGTITATSSQEKGTTILVRLPS